MHNANDRQIGGDHYKSTFQHWDFVQYLGLKYLPAQITRYVQRWRKKNGIQDLDKALHYVDKLIEEEGKRHREHHALMEEFMRTHNLQEYERIVFNMLVNYQLGDMDRLDEARNAILELRSILVGENEAPIVAVDPVFRESRDEWKNN